MGTNYYIRTVITKSCETCGKGQEYEEMHIGKSSMGWKFKFNANSTSCHSIRDMVELIEENEGFIFDEYGNEVSCNHIFSTILRSQGGKSEESHDTRFVGGFVFNYFDFC